MKFVVEEIKPFRALFESIASILDEANLEASDEGVTISGLDRSHITFVEMCLDKDYFLTYNCNDPVKLGLDMEEVVKILKRGKPDDVIEVESLDNKLRFTMEGEARKTFHTILLSLDYEQPSPPNLEYDNIIDVSMDIISNAIPDIKVAGDIIRFTHDGEYLYITGEDEMVDVTIKVFAGSTAKEKVSSKFGIEKIQNMIKSKGFGDVVKLSIGDDMPLQFAIGDEDSFIRFLLAPRIEAE